MTQLFDIWICLLIIFRWSSSMIDYILITQVGSKVALIIHKFVVWILLMIRFNGVMVLYVNIFFAKSIFFYILIDEGILKRNIAWSSLMNRRLERWCFVQCLIKITVVTKWQACTCMVHSCTYMTCISELAQVDLILAQPSTCTLCPDFIWYFLRVLN